MDMTGWVMAEHGVPDSRLTVIEQAEDYIYPSSGKHRVQWLCKCNCKDEGLVVASGSQLRNGRVKSCGCLHRESIAAIGKKNKKYNAYQLIDNTVIGFDDNNNSFSVMLEDYELIKDYYWSMDANGYFVARDKNKQMIKMHRLIMNASNEEMVDHIDRNRSNNIRNNLRLTDAKGNAINHEVRKSNRNNITGITWYDKNQKWRAFVIVNGKNKYVYYGDNKNEAIKARLEAEVKYYGEFAPQKHLFEKYGIAIQN